MAAPGWTKIDREYITEASTLGWKPGAFAAWVACVSPQCTEQIKAEHFNQEIVNGEIGAWRTTCPACGYDLVILND